MHHRRHSKSGVWHRQPAQLKFLAASRSSWCRCVKPLTRRYGHHSDDLCQLSSLSAPNTFLALFLTTSRSCACQSQHTAICVVSPQPKDHDHVYFEAPTSPQSTCPVYLKQHFLCDFAVEHHPSSALLLTWASNYSLVVEVEGFKRISGSQARPHC